MDVKKFRKIVWNFYTKEGRNLPWRKTTNPYNILVSEIMLQQTQVDRVIPKYEEWLSHFPTFQSLDQANLHTVLKKWKGLGYNRRALNLKKTAHIVEKTYMGQIPKETEKLLGLPGIGPYTTGALQAFIWNIPSVLIETNIRAVYLHHFFPKKENVHDKELLEYIERTLDTQNPREWYYALMDYGAYLKKTLLNPSRKSAHHNKQTPFKNSNREERSRLLSYILNNQPVTKKQILRGVVEKHNLEKNLRDLKKEGFISEKDDVIVIS